MQRRSALKRVGGTILLTAGLSSTTAAKRGGAPADITVPNDHSTIQAAVDAANSGDTVLVDGGTYREQVLINKDLTLKGENEPVIEATDSLSTYRLVESGTDWAPIVLAYGGTLSSGEVSGAGTVEVNISGITIDGRGNTGQAGAKTGILYRNVNKKAEIQHNNVVNVATPGGSIGIVAYGDSDVRIENNEVTNFGRGGIGANGDGGAHPSPNVVVNDNYIDSESGAGGSAPNGIQIGYGTTGQVQGNTVKNCRYSDDADSTWQASGILIFESDGIKVQKNNLEDNDVAIAASAWGWFADSADNNDIAQNTIQNSLIGVNLRCTAWAPYTSEDPSVSNNKVVNNEISDAEGEPEGDIGIAVERNDQLDGYTPTTDNNKVIQNSITGFAEQVSNEGTGTKIRAIKP